MDMSYDRSNFEARNFQQKIILEHLPLEYVLICTQLCMRNRDRFDIIASQTDSVPTQDIDTTQAETPHPTTSPTCVELDAWRSDRGIVAASGGDSAAQTDSGGAPPPRPDISVPTSTDLTISCEYSTNYCADFWLICFTAFCNIYIWYDINKCLLHGTLHPVERVVIQFSIHRLNCFAHTILDPPLGSNALTIDDPPHPPHSHDHPLSAFWICCPRCLETTPVLPS
eukprot:g37021.t1